MTKKDAIRLAQSGWWKKCDARTIALLQLSEQKLCMDFADLQAAVEEALGRPVWTHEFARPDELLAELGGAPGPKSLADVLAKLETLVAGKG